MNKEELKRYIDGLDDQTEIILVTTKEQANVIPKHCERLEFQGTTAFVLRKLKQGMWAVVVAWVLTYADDIPRPHAVFLTAMDKIEIVVKNVNYDFPYPAHDTKHPLLAFEFNGTTHFLPPSGLSPEALAATGSLGTRPFGTGPFGG